MKQIITTAARQALIDSLESAYMEIFPTPTIESKLDVLEPGSHIGVTCSPDKGIDETLDMSQRLSERGFKVIPHIAAKMVKDKAHLSEIMKRLNDLPITSLFVPGGDAKKPAGSYTSALELLQDIADFDHKLTDIGVASHPEGHPQISKEVLMEQLLKKQDYADYLVTQMCFDAGIIGSWLTEIREYGIKLPAWIGLPSVSQRSSLLTTSLRIGVGNSLRYLKNRGNIAKQLMKSKEYRPDELLMELAPYIADPEYGIEGHHIYCFNAVEKAEQWRLEFLEQLKKTNEL